MAVWNAEAPSDKYYKAAKLADALQRGDDEQPGVHYKVDEKQKSVLLTEEGYEAAEDVLGVSSFPSSTPQLSTAFY